MTGSFHQQLARNAEQRKRYEDDAAGIQASLAGQNDVLLERTTAFDGLARALKGKEAALDAARAGVYNAITDAAAEKSRIANIETRVHQLDELDHDAQTETDELAKKLEDLTALLDRKEQEISEIAARRAGLQEEHGRVTVRLEAAVARKKELDAELGAAKSRLAGQSSRLHSLIELGQSLEGYQQGVQAVMAAKKAPASDRVGAIHGLVADIIETEPKYETAIEAVLGDRLQNVVVGSQNDSLKAIEYLKTSGAGRSTFIPEAPRSIPSEPFQTLSHAFIQNIEGPESSSAVQRDLHPEN